MLNNVKSLCKTPITQVQKYMYIHSCVCVYVYIFLNYMRVYIYIHVHIHVIQKHINISYTGILFARSKLTK